MKNVILNSFYAHDFEKAFELLDEMLNNYPFYKKKESKIEDNKDYIKKTPPIKTYEEFKNKNWKYDKTNDTIKYNKPSKFDKNINFKDRLPKKAEYYIAHLGWVENKNIKDYLNEIFSDFNYKFEYETERKLGGKTDYELIVKRPKNKRIFNFIPIIPMKIDSMDHKINEIIFCIRIDPNIISKKTRVDAVKEFSEFMTVIDIIQNRNHQFDDMKPPINIKIEG